MNVSYNCGGTRVVTVQQNTVALFFQAFLQASVSRLQLLMSALELL